MSLQQLRRTILAYLSVIQSWLEVEPGINEMGNKDKKL